MEPAATNLPAANLPAETARLAEPPTGTAGIEATPTLAITDIAPSPTPDGMAAAVVEEEAAGGESLAPVVPVTGTKTEPEENSQVCAPHRLSNMLAYTIYDFSGEVVGVVDGLVVFLPLAEPAADVPPETEQTPVVSLPVPRIVYAITDLDHGTGLGSQDIFLPFGLMAFPPLQDGDIRPGEAGAVQPGKAGCGFTLTVERSVLAESPVVADNSWQRSDFGLGRPDWDAAIRQYWDSQGFPISEEPGHPQILADFHDGAITDLEGRSLGRVVDFVIDAQTNRFEYAVLSSAGVSNGEKGFVVIPVRLLRWGTVTGSVGLPAGRLTADAPPSLIQDAPSFASLDVFDAPAGPWRDQVDAYWDGGSPLSP